MNIRVSIFAFLFVAFAAFSGCTETDRNRNTADADSDAAWNDFRASADRAETEARQDWREARYDVNEETGEWNDSYDRNVARMEENSANWTDERRREYEETRERYRTANETRQANYQRQQRYRKLNTDLLGGTELSAMTAANARQMYESFVNKVDAQKANFSKEDWEEVDRIWEAMDDRYDKLDGVPTKDKAVIAKEKTKYNGYKTGAAVRRNT